VNSCSLNENDSDRLDKVDWKLDDNRKKVKKLKKK